MRRGREGQETRQPGSSEPSGPFLVSSAVLLTCFQTDIQRRRFSPSYRHIRGERLVAVAADLDAVQSLWELHDQPFLALRPLPKLTVDEHYRGSRRHPDGQGPVDRLLQFWTERLWQRRGAPAARAAVRHS